MRMHALLAILIFITSFQSIFSASMSESGDERRIQKFNAIIRQYEKEIQNDPENLKLILAVAEVYYSLKEYAKSITYYKRALELDPKNIKIKTSLALAYLNNHDLTKSQELLQEVLKTEPFNLDAISGMGRIQALYHNFKEAENFYNQVLEKDPNHFTTLFYLAELRIEQKRFAEAEGILNKLLQNDPSATWVKQALQRAKFGPALENIEETKDYSGAITTFKKQLEEDPANLELYLILAKLYTKTGNYDEAINLLLEGQRRYPKENAFRLALGFTYLAANQLTNAEYFLEAASTVGSSQSEAIAGLGRVASLKGNVRKAEKLYQKALQLNPVNTLALSYLAELRMKQKRYDDAKFLFEKIIQLDPKATWAKLAVDDAKLAPVLEKIEEEERLNHFESAEKLYEELLDQFPNNANNYIRFSRYYRNQRQYQKALEIALLGLRINPKSIPLYVELGYNYLLIGELEKSQQAFAEALAYDPANTEALAGMGRIHALIGDWENAEHFYQWALKINPRESTALSYLIDLEMEQKNYPTAQKLARQALKLNPQARWAQETLLRAKYADDFNEINVLQAIGQDQEAILRLQMLLSLAPESEEAYLKLGRLYTSLKRYKEAVQLYKKGLIINPSANQLRVNLGLAYLNMNKISEAKQALQTAYKIDSKNADAIAGLGRIAAIAGDKEKAQKMFQLALSINPDNLLALSFLADFKMAEKQFSEAETTYAKILEVNPQAAWAKSGLENAKYAPLLQEGEEKEKNKDFAEAEAIYLKLIAEAPNNEGYYFKLGRLYIDRKRYLEAIELYQKALQVNPDSNSLLLALGFAYLAKGDLTSGKQIFAEVLDKDSENAEAFAGLGRYEELTGNKNQAFALYQKALKIDPDNLSSLVFLSGLMVEMGFYDDAQKLYKRIHRLQPTEDWIRLAIEDAKYGRLLAEIKTKETANDALGAEILWKQLLQESPYNISYYLRMGLFYQNIKEYQKAVDILLKGIKIAPESSELHSALGLAYLSLKEYSRARRAFKKSQKLDPKNPDALAGLGYLATVNEKYREAESLINEALRIDPDRIAALSAMGNLLTKERRYPEAQKVYEKLLSLRPNDKWIRPSLEDAINGNKLDEIKALIADDKFAEAAEGYRSLLENFPNNAHYYFGLGQMYMRLKEYGKSIETNIEGLEKNPEENELRVALGYAYFFNDNLAQAREELSKALEKDEKNAEALAGLGRIYALEDDFDTAEIFYKKALEIDPKNLSAISFYGDLLMKQKRYSEAQEVFTALSKILPNAEWVQRSLQDAIDGPLTNIANQLADREEFELAANIYRDLIASSPNDAGRFLALGQMYVNLQQYCCGIDIYMQGLMIDPDAWYLWRAIAFAYIFLEEFETSQCIFDYLLELDQNDAESWAGLGRIEALNGSICLAEEYYANALAIAPRNLTALSFLAELQQNEEYNFSALDTFNTIYEVADNNRMGSCDPLPKWVRRGYNKALNLTYPTLNIGGAYHEEDQWDPTLHRWSAEYLVYGGKALFNYPLQDDLTVWGSFADQFFELKDLLNRKYIYSFDVQRFHIGARWVYSPCLFVDAKAGISDYSPYSSSTFRMKRGTIAEPSLNFTYHTPIEKATLGFFTSSDLIARNFNSNVAKLVGYYTLAGTYERKIIKRGWIGFEADAYWFNDFVHNNSQRVLGWFQWRPPCYSDNILFRYFVKCQTFAKNIPDYYTYQPQIVNQLQVTLEKFWRVCWADTFYTSLSYGHGWQDTRTRFSQIIVINPLPVRPPFVWDRRQFDIVFGTLIYKRDQLQVTFAADYYRDTEKYTIWTVGVDLGWRF